MTLVHVPPTYPSPRALRLHPDKGGDPELFKEVTHASVLPILLPNSYLLSLPQLRNPLRPSETQHVSFRTCHLAAEV